ncbi:MAG TPA: ABC transporter permease [Solirubrobacterales bacterium]|jgi:osmoprotectant transport system permease protein|nr:ABC transporter permease [Solirubrobacterales bacterium]
MLGFVLPLLAQVQIREAGSGATTCEGKNDAFCPGFVIDNIDDYVSPFLEHIVLVLASVLAGFVVAMALAIVSHGRRWLIPVFIGTTGVLYTIPSIALFLLLLPITGRGTVTALIALSLYNLQIIYRNANSGLANVPDAARDAGRGMGMTDRQLLWRVEIPLAVPEIIAGIRIATVSTVAIATLAIFAGAGGLGEILYNEGIQRDVFKTNIVFGSVLAVALAISFDGLLVLAQRFIAPWRKVRAL